LYLGVLSGRDLRAAADAAAGRCNAIKYDEHDEIVVDVECCVFASFFTSASLSMIASAEASRPPSSSSPETSSTLAPSGTSNSSASPVTLIVRSFSVSYLFDPPDISPMLAFSGPAEVAYNDGQVFREARQWTTAIDYVFFYYVKWRFSWGTTTKPSSIPKRPSRC
jgi:hypothetical protein